MADGVAAASPLVDQWHLSGNVRRGSGGLVAVLLVAVLHFLTDEENPAATVARFREAMAPGSYLVISHGEATPEVRQAEKAYQSASAPGWDAATSRSRASSTASTSSPRDWCMCRSGDSTTTRTTRTASSSAALAASPRQQPRPDHLSIAESRPGYRTGRAPAGPAAGGFGQVWPARAAGGVAWMSTWSVLPSTCVRGVGGLGCARPTRPKGRSSLRRIARSPTPTC